MDSNNALKFPFPKLFDPFLWIISKKRVGLSWRGLVKICNKYPSSSESTKMPNFSKVFMSSSILPTLKVKFL